MSDGPQARSRKKIFSFSLPEHHYAMYRSERIPLTVPHSTISYQKSETTPFLLSFSLYHRPEDCWAPDTPSAPLASCR